MKNHSKISIFFYFTTGLVSAAIISAILHGLDWPIISEAIIGVALFIHSILLARSAKDFFTAAYEKGIVSDWILLLQQSYNISNGNRDTGE